MARVDDPQTVDTGVQQVLDVLAGHTHQHPQAKVAVYRYNPVSIRVRIVDPEFRGRDRVEREAEVWPFLETLPEDVYCDLTMLLLLTPEEAMRSFANLEFDDPVPSGL